ncbi:MAG: N-acetyl-gamma-glutamyl-phosphate reductase, partial [Gammaproteobacteria bacterium]
MPIRVGIYGASGYTGLELVRYLALHPDVALEVVTSRQYGRKRLRSMVSADLQQLVGNLRFIEPEPKAFEGLDAVFIAAPNGIAASVARTFVGMGIRVFDLSADFRLKDAALWQQWYGQEHPDPELLPDAVYGLAEFARNELPQAQLISVPGCYPTAVLLPLLPLLNAKLLDPSVTADCASGVSGAGRTADLANLYAEVTESYRAYKVSGHRHLPEIQQAIRLLTSLEAELVFVPHLVPMIRGMLSTIHVRSSSQVAPDRLLAKARNLIQQHYADSPLIQVASDGDELDTAQVRGTSMAQISVHQPHALPDRLILQCAIDNLGKGAAGQAVQCFNLA